MEHARDKLFTAFWWCLTLTWAGLIFHLSTATFGPTFSQRLLVWATSLVHWRLSPREVLLLDNLVRKLAHVTEYAIFALLLYGRGPAEVDSRQSTVDSNQGTVDSRQFTADSNQGTAGRGQLKIENPKSKIENPRAARLRRAAWCVLAAGLYSLTDEFHQIFVPGRHASLLDCGLDTLGASVAMLAPLAAKSSRQSTVNSRQ